MDGDSDTRARLAAVPATGQPGRNPRFRLPASLAKIQAKARLQLQGLLARMFDHADDALFEMADRASSNHEQNVYFECMRELRLERAGIELGFTRNYDTGFVDIGSGQHGERAVKEVDAATLSLVNEMDIEKVVAIEGMVKRVLSGSSDELSLLSMRFESLLGGVRLTHDTHPLAPRSICESFTDACAKLDIDMKAKLFLLKLFEKTVLRELPSLYQALNRELAAEGVLPNISLADRRKSSASETSPGREAGVRKAKRDRGEAGFGLDDDAMFSQLQALIRSGELSSQQLGSMSESKSSVKIVRRAMVLDWLSSLQDQVPKLATDSVGYVQELPPRRDVRQLIEDLLEEQSESGCYELGREDEDAISLVSLFFQYVLDDSQLALPLKSQMSLLQVPVAKVALVDKSFFGKNNHPARKLLNAMAQAGTGWQPAPNASRDFLYLKVKHTVGAVLSRFEDDIGVFQEVLADFSSFLENERRRAAVVEQRTMEAEKGRARAEAAKDSVNVSIKQCTADKQLPGVILELLEHAWSKVLFLIYVREGDASDHWKSAVQVMEELVWSVQPKPGQAERSRLTRMRPNLIKSIRAGLGRIGFSHFAMNHFFEQLDTMHRCLLQKPAAEADKVMPSESGRSESTAEESERAGSDAGDATLDALLSGSEKPVPEVAFMRLADDAKTRESSRDEDLAPVDEDMLSLIDKLTMGSWVQFNQADQGSFRCRLAAVMKPTGKYIFVNRAGKKVAEWSREQLAANVAANIVDLLDDRQLFDRALESVIMQLQSGRR